MMTRKNLPEQQEFVDYMREQTSVKELFEKTGITKTTIEHWFRRDKAGFSHPSIEDWEKIKPHLKTIKYDNVMTALHSIEWKQDPKSMWPTPTTKGFGHASEGQTMIMRRKVEAGELTEEEAQAMMNGTTLRPPRLKKWMWPTPKASGQEKLDTLIKRKGVKAAVQHNLTAAVEMWPTPTARSQRTKQSETHRGETETQLSTTQSIKTEGNHWEFEPDVGRVAYGIPGRVHRLKALGNSIVPKIVEEIGYALIKGMK